MVLAQPKTEPKPIVYVAIYKHSKGETDVRVFESEDDAYAWRTEIAKEEWARSWAEAEPDDVANEYFDRVSPSRIAKSNRPWRDEAVRSRLAPNRSRRLREPPAAASDEPTMIRAYRSIGRPRGGSWCDPASRRSQRRPQT